MTTLISNAAPPHVLLELFDAARRVLREWRRRWQARQTAHTLHGLPDFVLKDIGLHRSDIDRRFRS